LFVVSHTDRHQRIERLQDDREIGRGQFPVDELEEGLLDAIGTLSGVDVIFIQKEGKEPRAIPRGLALLVGLGLNRPRGVISAVWSTAADESNVIQRLRSVVVSELEIARAQVRDGLALAVGGVDGKMNLDSGRGLRLVSWVGADSERSPTQKDQRTSDSSQHRLDSGDEGLTGDSESEELFRLFGVAARFDLQEILAGSQARQGELDDLLARLGRW